MVRVRPAMVRCLRRVIISRVSIKNLIVLMLLSGSLVYMYIPSRQTAIDTAKKHWKESHGHIIQTSDEGHMEDESDSDGLNDKTTDDMTGKERANYMRVACQKLRSRKQSHANYSSSRVRVSYDPYYNLLYCPMCKMGSTFWTRVFAMLKKNQASGKQVDTPFDIPIPPASHQYFSIQKQVVTPYKDASSSFKFMFVRHPYSLVFSAYVDKIVGPNRLFWKMYSRANSSACGSDITFKDFIEYVINEYFSYGELDCHVAKFTSCSPCALNYTYIAQMETFKSDTFHILSILNQTKTLEIFNDHFADLHAADAIDDAIKDVYVNIAAIKRCISWPNALRRIWRKLQIRGVIGAAKFPLTDEEANIINRNSFVQIAKQARSRATVSERKTMKTEAFDEAYSTLSDDLISKLSEVYHEDMLLFGYKPMVFELIKKRATTNVYRGYFDYSKELSTI